MHPDPGAWPQATDQTGQAKPQASGDAASILGSEADPGQQKGSENQERQQLKYVIDDQHLTLITKSRGKETAQGSEGPTEDATDTFVDPSTMP